MANKIAVVKADISYRDADGNPATIAEKTMRIPYEAQLHGTYDIADTTEAGTFLINFGAIAGANLILLENKTGQPIDVKLNSGAERYNAVAADDSVLLAVPSANLNAAVTAICIVTNATQVGNGFVGYHLFGDPS